MAPTELLDFTLPKKTDPRILLDCGPPRALYKVNPRLLLGKEIWDLLRKQAYGDYGHCCAACGKNNTRLEAHELYVINKKINKMYLKDIVPLCNLCHSFVHQELHRTMLKNREITTDFVTMVLNHGKAVLKKAGILNLGS